MKSIAWRDNSLIIIDQTELPNRLRYRRLNTGNQVISAIRKLMVRGAPLIGVAAAYGVVLEARRLKNRPRLRVRLLAAIDSLGSARPTAVNLGWALERQKKIVRDPAIDERLLADTLLREAAGIEYEETEACAAIGRFGAGIIRDGDRVMTYCNTGRLATPGIGTALGIFYTARSQGKKITVYACETRPLLQGARLTAFELLRSRIPVTVIADNMVASIMPGIDKVFVGADRIARNGDTANKIGTRTVAVVAFHYNTPFFVAAPASTFDPTQKTGSGIPIEYRDRSELARIGDIPVTPERTRMHNPAFDVTPAALITAFITDRGLLRPDYAKSIGRLIKFHAPRRR